MIFNENQISAINLSLEKAISPLKYCYITDNGSNAWSNIEIDRIKLGGNYAEYELLKDNIEMYLDDIGNPLEICFFDFGCGIGNTTKGMLEKLLEKGVKVNYHGFDISEKILKIAKNNIGYLGKNYTFNSTILDFENFNLSNILIEIRNSYGNIPVIGLLLGNTIGNFDSIDRILINIMESFRLKDRMIIGIEKSDLNNEKRMKEMKDGYKSDDVFNLAFSTLEYFGLLKERGNYNVIFNTEKNMIEGFFQLKEKVILNIDGNEIFYEKGDKIKLFQSKKMNEYTITRLLLGLDYRVASIRTNLKNTFIQTMISAKRY